MSAIIGYVVAAALVLGVCAWLGRFVRVGAPACPQCLHGIKGLVEPRCPECGATFEDGVLPKGGARPGASRLIGVAVVLLGFVLAGYGAFLVLQQWPRILLMNGVFRDQIWYEARTCSIIVKDAGLLEMRVCLESPTSVGEVEIKVIRNGTYADELLASWSGVGTRDNPEKYIQFSMAFDTEEAIASLQEQIPIGSSFPLAQVLHDPPRAKELEDYIDLLAGTQMQRFYLSDKLNARDNGILRTHIRAVPGPIGPPADTHIVGIIPAERERGIVWRESGWFWYATRYVPVYLIPLAIVGCFSLLAWRLIVRSKSRIPFAPYDREGTETSPLAPQSPESDPCASPSHSLPSSRASSS